MKTIATLVGVMVAGLAMIAAAISTGDRHTLVPPPDAVAESFTRELTSGSYDLAIRYLSRSRKATLDRDDLRDWFEMARRDLGTPNTVDAAVQWTTDERAAVQVTIAANSATAILSLGLTWEGARWVIDEWPAIVPVRMHK